MDDVLKPHKRPWIKKDKFHLKERLLERDEQLKASDIDFNVTEEGGDGQEGEFITFVDKFSRANETKLKPYFLFNTTDLRTLVNDKKCELKSYKLQLEHAKRMITDKKYRADYLARLRTTRRELLMRQLASINRETSEESGVMTTAGGYLLPIVVVQFWPQPKKSTKIRLDREVMFRGDQCLTDLRDQFKCPRDFGVPMDFSDDPKNMERVFLCEMFKSGYFLIGDTFYNDMRNPNNVDLSLDVIGWAEKKISSIDDEGRTVKISRGIGPFKSLKMEDAKFEDLEFRLGQPYLYTHQGDCEHLFTISDVRYETNNTKLSKINFPYVVASSVGRKSDTKCSMCKTRPPHWFTRNNQRLPVDPFLFCEKCFYSFNYKTDGSKIGSFQAYLYTDAYGIPESVTMPAT